MSLEYWMVRSSRTMTAGDTSVRRSPRIQVAWAIHGRELAAAQEHHARGKSSAPIDPALYLRRIHRIQVLRCLGIGYSTTLGTGIPGGVEPELGARGHAYLVMGNRAENDGAGRDAITVYDHHLPPPPSPLIFITIASPPAPPVHPNPH